MKAEKRLGAPRINSPKNSTSFEGPSFEQSVSEIVNRLVEKAKDAGYKAVLNRTSEEPDKVEFFVLSRGIIFLKVAAHLLKVLGQTRKHTIKNEAAYRMTRKILTDWQEKLKKTWISRQGQKRHEEWDSLLERQIAAAKASLHDLDVAYGKLIEQDLIREK